ncbi:hypothetical protein J2Z75_003720 [Rhizobium herbae]|uniref:Uncharacterized protein n=1 Tax=Rhizobium herbae TaxID=508661 RepID=A0ABS4EQH6_9HYPH|nr:hypothetical protein [Rhizobium herbae]
MGANPWVKPEDYVAGKAMNGRKLETGAKRALETA